ncbi:HipA family kinase [Leeuwenhoekiella sp. H156]|uniref:HipA family kinase n=1 Tax=Leeuwenhoekiella sp. H156 TaxID=3450128 RepID=UPI003FA41340
MTTISQDFHTFIVLKSFVVIEELKFVGIQNRLVGGSTMPVVIKAQDQSGTINPYVLKLYKADYVSKNFAVAKEILVSELASQFNLPVPKYGIIDFDTALLSPEYGTDFLKMLKPGYKFCNFYHEGTLLYTDSLKSSYLKNYDLELVFAFDNLILNADRGGFRNKPNLLLKDEDFLLIDHEQSLHFFDIHALDKALDYGLKFDTYSYKKHIFYKALKSRKPKRELFGEFDEYLRTLDLSFLEALFRDFETYGIDHGEKSTIFAYLQWCKVNRSTLIKSLNKRVL